MIAAVPKVERRGGSPEIARLIDLVHTVMMGSLRRVHPALAREGITMGQFWAIHTVSSLESASMSTVARYLGVTPPAMCSNIDQLEDAGLVKRQRSDSDRRTVMLYLTPRGRRVESRIWKEIAEVMADAGREVAPTDLAASVRVFGEVARRLRGNGHLVAPEAA